MTFCSNCFHDMEIKSMIKKNGTIGTCPICNPGNIEIYDTDQEDSEQESTLFSLFDNFLSVYTANDDLPDSYPMKERKTLVDAVKNDWDIFAEISDESIISILKSLAPEHLKDYPIIFEQPVGIPEKYNKDYLVENSILHTEKWDDFVESLKHKNRFHTNLVDTELLKKYCINIGKVIPVNKQRFYRGRIAKNKNGFSRSEMGAPPEEISTDGRANSAGISRLYLTNDRETTLHEIRAAEYDYVTIGTFKPVRPIRVVDLKLIHKISPFCDDVDCTALAINREHLIKINEEMSRTMRRGDSPLDYLPTQYICDFIMSITDENGKPLFDGIEYQSAMHSKGSNLTIFNPELFKCTYCSTYEVKKLQYVKKIIS